jgi:hypothetical protein
MKYKLNPERAINKKFEACKRDLNIEIEIKKGTLVMTLTSGAYELFKESIFQYYDKSTTRTYSITNKSSRSSGQNKNKLIVEESLSIKSNTGEKRNKQLFRINMFHTTSRIDVNGKGHQEFIETDIIKLMNTYGMNALNEKILMFCNTYTSTCQTINKHNTNKPLSIIPVEEDQCIYISTIHELQEMNSTYDRDSVEEKYKNMTVKYTKNKQGEKEIDEKEDEELVCAICNANIKGHEDTVECSECTLWIHCIFVNINPESSTEIIGYKENEFVCPECKSLQTENTLRNNPEIEIDTWETETILKQVISEEMSPRRSISIANNHSSISVNISGFPPEFPESITQHTVTIKPMENAIRDKPQNSEDICTRNDMGPASYQQINVTSLEKETSGKTKNRKVKKKEAISNTDEQLSACKARIIMLEVRNRDYNNTIHLLKNKLDVEDQYKYTSTSAIENHQKPEYRNTIHHDVDTKFKQLQDQMLTKIEWLNSEFQHRTQMSL